jgi:hypothetical protein
MNLIQVKALLEPFQANAAQHPATPLSAKERIIALRQMMGAFAALRYPAESVSRTEDFAIPGPAGKIPVRLYVPHTVILGQPQLFACHCLRMISAPRLTPLFRERGQHASALSGRRPRNIHARTQMQLINSGRAQSTYLEKHRLFNQMLGSRSRIAQKRLAGDPDLPAI